jgi:hypothetical protein
MKARPKDFVPGSACVVIAIRAITNRLGQGFRRFALSLSTNQKN